MAVGSCCKKFMETNTQPLNKRPPLPIWESWQLSSLFCLTAAFFQLRLLEGFHIFRAHGHRRSGRVDFTSGLLLGVCLWRSGFLCAFRAFDRWSMHSCHILKTFAKVAHRIPTCA